MKTDNTEEATEETIKVVVFTTEIEVAESNFECDPDTFARNIVREVSAISIDILNNIMNEYRKRNPGRVEAYNKDK